MYKNNNHTARYELNQKNTEIIIATYVSFKVHQLLKYDQEAKISIPYIFLCNQFSFMI